eukprot:TRINITY_DN2222_c0_g1_i1.p1 TRINITY_DN2222_c0_g1~~TRINITY_DN2222_c0_g1_i1.p1  ORF type:complete len:617 (+),score=208.75 TRINITY_DN2222_c0_g1_i1:102-1853(+)
MTATANSGPSNLMAMKLQSQAREHEEKDRLRRKRGGIVLIEQFLQDNGYYDACAALERESGISAGKYAAADNVSLLQCIQDYETYWEARFDHKPKLFRQVAGGYSNDHARGGGERELEKKPSRGNSAQIPTRRTESNSAGPTRRAAESKLGKDRPRATMTPPAESSRDTPPLPIPPKPDGKSDTPMEFMPTALGIAARKVGADISNLQGGGGVGRALPGARRQGNSTPAEDDEEEDGGAAFAKRQCFMRQLPNEWVGEQRELALMIQRDILDAAPNVKWDDIAALDDAKLLLKEAVVMPTKYPQFFTGKLRPWKGILLFGPPGTGKTMLAKAVATECNTTFFNISASSIVSKWRGDSEKLIKMLFDMARHYSPSTIFLDELDSIMSQRTSAAQEHEGSRRMKTELMIQMDGLVRDTRPDQQVFVLGASNIPWDLDDAILRRLEKRILVGMPSALARIKMFRNNLVGHCNELDIDFDALAERTKEYTGSDINVVCREAMMRTVRVKMHRLEAIGDDEEALAKELVALDNVTTSDLVHALAVTKASSQSIATAKYMKWNDDFGSARSGFAGDSRSGTSRVPIDPL